jgi:hypothetical protein
MPATFEALDEKLGPDSKRPIQEPCNDCSGRAFAFGKWSHIIINTKTLIL